MPIRKGNFLDERLKEIWRKLGEFLGPKR